jgi:outer membrane protein
MRRKFSWLGLLLVLLSASAGQAADVAVQPAAAAPSTWIVTIGADIRAVPRYPGSADFNAVPVPYFDIAKPGSPERFHGPLDGVGFAVFDNGVFAIGPVGSLIWSQRQKINGLGGVGMTLNLGGYVDYWAVPWLRTRAEVMQGLGAGDGITTNLYMDAVIPLSSAMTLSGGPRARYVTAATESPYFTVTPAQSLASGLPAYNAGGGWQSVGAGTQLKYRFNPVWATYGFAEYQKLIGPSANSPIVTGPGGTANQWIFGIGVTYSFAMSGLPF